MRTAIWVGVGGFFGSMARYGVAGVVSRVNEAFAWGTFVVNVTGSFAAGLLIAALGHRLALHPDLRIAVTVGFIGAYTTFSTFTLETFEFAETGSGQLAIVNVVASVAVGVIAVWAGTLLGRNI